MKTIIAVLLMSVTITSARPVDPPKPVPPPIIIYPVDVEFIVWIYE